MTRFIRFLTSFLALAVCAGSAIAQPSAASAEPSQLPRLGKRVKGEDWPGFLGPRGDGTSAEQGIATVVNGNGKLKVAWRLELGASYGTVCITRGRALVFDRVGKRTRLRCLNSETGEELWEYGYPINYEDMFGYNNGPRCQPITDGRLAYIYGPEGKLHCVNLADGNAVWKVDANDDYGVVTNFFGVGSTPAIHNDLLIVMVGGSPDSSQGLGAGALGDVEGDGSGIVAFDRFTGKERYRITDELASYSSPRIARINGRDWAFVMARGGLVAFEPATGKIDFQFPWRAKILESVNASSPVVLGSQVFVTETYGPGGCLLDVAAGKPGEPKIVWRDEERSRVRALPAHWNTPVYREGYMYGSAGRHSSPAELRCVEWKTGKIQWREPGLTRSSLMYVDGHFVCVGEDGTLRVIKANPGKYEEVAELQLIHQGEVVSLEYPAWAAPVLSHGLLYVRGKNSLVCAEFIPQ